MNPLLRKLEARAGGPVAASRLLGVSYTGTYASLKAGRSEFQPYQLASIKAHLALDDQAFAKRLDESS